ncbi:2OG-Fe dioxygenase family protein [Streptomyces sp. NPDC005438]|uniref:2OG-Fe dioxygenase family protein n=1 Tax=Streptomyces sp. NPDC005438 TaxID=3156880 RepID=UPI0033BB78A1
MEVTATATGTAPRSVVDEYIESTARRGFAFLPHASVRPLLGEGVLEDFQAAWEDLELDTEIPGGKQFRLRRYGRLRVEPGPSGTEFEALAHSAFRQDAIEMWRGQNRVFAPVAADTLLHGAMRALVGLDVEIASAVSGVTRWDVGIHLVRILAKPGADGEPTPEGRHRDGHAFVGMHLLRRDHLTGGHSTLHLEDATTVDLTLARPLDSVLVDDGRLTHEVTPISPAGDTGIRDMLLVDLNPAAEPTAAR